MGTKIGKIAFRKLFENNLSIILQETGLTQNMKKNIKFDAKYNKNAWFEGKAR